MGRRIVQRVPAARYALLARHPHAVDGRGAVAAKYMGRQHAVRRQITQRHMLRIQRHQVGLLAHSEAINGTARSLRPAVHSPRWPRP